MVSESRNIDLKITRERNNCPEGFEYDDNFDDTKTGSQSTK